MPRRKYNRHLGAGETSERSSTVGEASKLTEAPCLGMLDAELPLATAFRAALITKNGVASKAHALRTIRGEIASAKVTGGLSYVSIAAMFSVILASVGINGMTSDDLRGQLGFISRSKRIASQPVKIVDPHTRSAPQNARSASEKSPAPTPAEENAPPPIVGHGRMGSFADEIIRNAEQRQKLQNM